MYIKPHFHSIFQITVFIFTLAVLLQADFRSSPVYASSGAVAAPDALPDHLEVTVSTGTFGSGKLGTYQPVIVTIPSSYEGTEGTAALTFLTSDSRHYRYESAFSVTSDGACITFYVPAFSTSVPIQITLTVNEQIIYSNHFTLNSAGISELTIGILSSFPGDYTDWQLLSVSDTVSIYTNTQLLSADTVPSDELSLQTYDVMILEKCGADILSPEQFEAICTWLSYSDVPKTLILSMPDETQLHSFSRLTGPVSLSHSYLLKDLNELAENQSLQSVRISLNCSSYSSPNAYVLSDENGNAIISKILCGRGTVFLTAFPIHEIAPLLASDPLFFHEFWDLFLSDSDLTELLAQQRTFSDYENTVADVFTGQQQSAYISRIHYYSWVLILYLVLTIVLILFLFQRGKTRHYLRLTMSLNALLFAGIIYFIARPTRHDNIFMHSISLNEYREDKLYSISYSSVQAPYNASFSLEADPSYRVMPTIPTLTANPVPYQIDSAMQAEHGLVIASDDSSTLLHFENQVAFHPEYFQLERTSSCTPAIEQSVITLYDGKLSGTLTSRLDHTISDAVILINGILIPIGDFLPDETIDLSRLPVYTRNEANLSPLIQHLILAHTGEVNPSRLKQTADMGIIFLNDLLNNAPEDAILFGRLKAPGNIFHNEGIDFDSYYDNFEAIHFQVSCRNVDFIYEPQITLPPRLLDGSYDVHTREMLTDTTTLAYRFYSNMQIESIHLTADDWPTEMSDTPSLPSLAYAYNWKKKAYDLLTDDTLDSNELALYLQDNQILFYFVKQLDQTTYLPELSVIWKQNDSPHMDD